MFPKTQHKFPKAQIFSLAFPSCSNLRNCETCVRTPTFHKEIPHVPFVRLTRIPLRNIKKLRFPQEETPPKEKTGTQKPCHRPFSVFLRIPAPASRDIFCNHQPKIPIAQQRTTRSFCPRPNNHKPTFRTFKTFKYINHLFPNQVTLSSPPQIVVEIIYICHHQQYSTPNIKASLAKMPNTAKRQAKLAYFGYSVKTPNYVLALPMTTKLTSFEVSFF